MITMFNQINHSATVDSIKLIVIKTDSLLMLYFSVCLDWAVLLVLPDSVGAPMSARE